MRDIVARVSRNAAERVVLFDFSIAGRRGCVLDSPPAAFIVAAQFAMWCTMQILNVGAGRTDEEYKAAEEQRLSDLRSDSRSDANYFFLAAGLSALGTGLLPVRLNLLVSIGMIDLLTLYGRPESPFYPLALYSAAAMWLLIMLRLGFAGRSGYRWAFLAGIAIYAADMVALILTFSLWAFGLHAFFVLKWFQGQKALKDLTAAGISTT